MEKCRLRHFASMENQETYQAAVSILLEDEILLLRR